MNVLVYFFHQKEIEKEKPQNIVSYLWVMVFW